MTERAEGGDGSRRRGCSASRSACDTDDRLAFRDGGDFSPLRFFLEGLSLAKLLSREADVELPPLSASDASLAAATTSMTLVRLLRRGGEESVRRNERLGRCLGRREHGARKQGKRRGSHEVQPLPGGEMAALAKSRHV